MCFFKKKQVGENQKIINNNDLLKGNVAKLSVLCTASKDEDIVKRLTVLIDKLKYSSPSNRESIQKIDGKISNKADDLKIMILGNKSSQKINEEIDALEILIAERLSTLEAGI